MKKIYFVIGTKAQFIKCKPVINYLATKRQTFVIFTNQHFEFINQSKNELDNKVKIIQYFENSEKLDSIYKNIAWFISCIFRILFKKTFNLEKNSFVVNHGDTLSALLGTFIAKKNNCIAVHLEAGGRSGKALKPFPEEIIRKIVSYRSKFLIADGKEAMDNLNKYYKNKNKFTTTTNTAYENIDFTKLQLSDNSIGQILILIHRSENIYSKRNLKKFCSFLKIMNNVYPNTNFVWILHPSTKKQLIKYGLFSSIQKFIFISELVSHEKFIEKLYHSKLFITDSLSSEFESYVMRKKTIIWRNSFINRFSTNNFIYIKKSDKNTTTVKKATELVEINIGTEINNYPKPSEEFYNIVNIIENNN
ncbi:UDP-N-acetylglucosamine 2-epimerase [Acidimicrobiia bacterium]|nr:UDP-N-acetylglucosamine 2-epimerase [Acidimicrobiia bacterium]